MHTFTTTFKVQTPHGSLVVHHFESEAKDRTTAESRNFEKLYQKYDEELRIISSTTRASQRDTYNRTYFRLSDKQH